MENVFLAQVVRELTAGPSPDTRGVPSAPGVVGLKVVRVSGAAPATLLLELSASEWRQEPPSRERGRSRPGIVLAVCLDAALPCLVTLDGPLPAAPAANNPEGFIRTLSQTLKGTVVARVEQNGRDRVARVVFAREFDNAELVMWVELFGRRPIAVLVEGATGAVLASSREGVRSASGGILHVGATYSPPVEMNKTAVDALTLESLRGWMEEKSEEELSVRLSRRIEGLSPNAALEVIHWAGGGTESLLEELGRRLARPEQSFAPAVRTPAAPEARAPDARESRVTPAAGSAAATQGMLDGQAPPARFDLALFPFGGAAVAGDPRYTVLRFNSATEAVRHSLVQLCLWYRLAASRRLKSDAVAVRGKLEKLRVALAEDMAVAERGDHYSRAGELILSHMKEIPRGADTVQLRDIHGDGTETVEVRLDPALSQSENADRYFRKARKAKRSREVLDKRIADVEQRLRAIDKFVSEVPDEVGPNDLTRLRQRLGTLGGTGAKAATAGRAIPYSTGRGRDAAATGRAAAGTSASRSRRAAATSRAQFNPRIFTTSEGYTVVVGRNNSENDYVTHRLAKPEDLWFHAYGVTGSHVILRHRGRAAPSRRAIEEAASIAAYFSKAKTSSAAPVIYTQKKFVHKPRGARPGTAGCAREKMVMAKPVKPRPTEPE
ncbi:MAG: DUF814 domain-containing protein [Candidatus Eisenbacteria bacterium]|nr:DUF814 domain-containing protein [Candidatus Eisenbacteria bacterium]